MWEEKISPETFSPKKNEIIIITHCAGKTLLFLFSSHTEKSMENSFGK
jgi:hypothetical protein